MRSGPAARSAAHRRALALAAPLCAALVACGEGPFSSTTRDVIATVAEACNGLDDDGDGVVDGLDASGDGLCDCLRVGVIGYPGEWRTNDLIKGWLHGRKTVPTTLLGGQTLTPEILSDLDVLLVQDVRDGVAEGTVGEEGIGEGIGRVFTDEEVQALRAWVEAGGGLLTLAGFSLGEGETTNVNRLLAPFGLSYGSQHILLSSGLPPGTVGHFDPAHPIARGVSRVGFEDGYPVSGGTLVAWEPAQGAYDVGRAVEVGRGRVFAWGDEWITYDSEWSNHSEFQVQRLWINAFAWLTREGYCRVALPD